MALFKPNSHVLPATEAGVLPRESNGYPVSAGDETDKVAVNILA